MEQDLLDIRNMRTELNLSQAKLSKMLGIQQSIVSQWELGKKKPTEIEIARVLEVIDETKKNVQNGNVRLNKKNFIHDFSKNKERLPKYISNREDYLEKTKNINYKSLTESSKEYFDFLNYLDNTLLNNLEYNSEAPKGIAFFAGCGGMSLGFKAANFNLVGYVEIDEPARKIYEANFPNTECLGTDINDVTDEQVHNWKSRFGHIHILVGGPPCQGFSLAGKRDCTDDRNKLYMQYNRIANILQPEVFVLENVRLMTSMKDTDGELFIKKIIKSFEDIGYYVIPKEVNAQDYGAPQCRERIIIVGVRKTFSEKAFEFPSPTHIQNVDNNTNMQLALFESSKPLRTFRDATCDLQSLESGDCSPNDPLHFSIVHPDHVINWLKNVPEGKSAHENPDPELRPKSGYNTTYKRLVMDEPSSTISTNFNMISGCRNVHPINTRSITIREATRCQSFPDKFAFFGTWGDIRRVIGNAVPPILSYTIAKEIMKSIFKK